MSCKCKNIIENFQGGSIPLPTTIGSQSACTSATTTVLIVSGKTNFGCDINVLNGGGIFSGGTNILDIFSNGSNIYNSNGQLLNNRVIDVSGYSLTISGESDNVLTIIGSGDTEPLFTVQGSSGELFSITDSLVGELFAVSDISGIPILKVFDDDRILMGSNFAPSLNTTLKSNPGTGLSTLYTLPMSAYTGAWYEYTVSNTGGVRAGSIVSVFSGNTAVLDEYSTTDIGDTSDIQLSVSADTTNAYLQVSATTTGWEVKTIVRSI